MQDAVSTSDAPVIINFLEASTPRNEIAQRLQTEAMGQLEKLNGNIGKAGKLRVVAEKRTDVFWINPYAIKVSAGWNNRTMNSPDTLAHIDSLAISIAHQGVKRPLTVTMENNSAVLVDGECRLLATFRAIEVYGAEIATIPAIADGRFADDASRLADQVVLNGGKAFSPLEQGKVFVKLIGFGWTHARIAQTVGLTTVRVAQILDLMAESNTCIKDLVATGQIAASTAAKVLKASGDVMVAEASLKTAVALAQSQGKKRATAKHIATAEGAKVTMKAELQSILAAEYVSATPRGRNTVIEMPTAKWNRVLTLLKLS